MKFTSCLRASKSFLVCLCPETCTSVSCMFVSIMLTRQILSSWGWAWVSTMSDFVCCNLATVSPVVWGCCSFALTCYVACLWLVVCTSHLYSTVTLPSLLQPLFCCLCRLSSFVSCIPAKLPIFILLWWIEINWVFLEVLWVSMFKTKVK